MRGHKLISFYLFLILSFTFSYSQINTFGSFTKMTKENYSVKATADGGFIISGVTEKPKQTQLIKVDNNGSVSWHYPFPGSGRSGVTVTVSGDYMLATKDIIEDSTILYLNYVSSDGVLQWQKIFNYGTERLIIFNPIQVSDFGFIIPIYKYGPAYLLKVDSVGNKMWDCELSRCHPSFPIVSVIETSVHELAVTAYKDFYILNADGSEKLKVEGMSGLDVAEAADGNFIIMYMSTIKKINPSGTLVWEKNYPVFPNPRELALTLEGDIIVCGNYLIRMNSKGETINYISLIHPMTGLTIVTDGGYVVVGSYEMPKNQFGDFIKYDTQLQSRYLMFTNPTDNSCLITENTYMVQWLAENAGLVDIDYSTNGSDWNTIAASFPADSQQVEFQTPFDLENTLSIRIKSQNDPSLVDYITQITLSRRKADYLAVNQLKMWFNNRGSGSHNPYTDGSGLYWPGGENATITAIFQDGLIWGGLLNGDTMVHGNTYRDGLVPGNILSDGSAADPNDDQFSTWKVRKDWQSYPNGQERDLLEYNWNHWPAHLGAPYEDINSNGSYDPSVDNPAKHGDAASWVVANATDSVATEYLYGAKPIAVEEQISIYAYNRSDGLKDVIFKLYKLVNKSEQTIDSMCISYWSDPDLGESGDDYVGCDSILNLAYCYNGDNNDEGYYGQNPPAVGYVLLQGPVVEGQASDKAFTFGNWINGYRNLNTSAFTLYINSDPLYQDPDLGKHRGSIMMYNYMRGKAGSGEPFTDPGGNIVQFVIPGDPVTGTGWYEGEGWPGGPAPGDRRMVLSTGPFTFAPGDSQEVVFAIIMAQGNTHLESVSELKEKTIAVTDFYYTGVYTGINKNPDKLIARQFTLDQNYPNPFNPKTIINYELPITNYVDLSIYNILGQKVKALVNKKQGAGQYKVEWDASGFASGVYLYRLSTSSGYTFTRKLIVIK